MSKRWSKLTNDELRGAHYGLRVLRTSPRIRGAALDLLDDLLVEIADDSRRRTKGKKGLVAPPTKGKTGG